MSSWRIRTQLDDRSAKVLESPPSGVGATVVHAPRGTARPKLFRPGQTDRILALLGRPNSKYPNILEVIEYNNSYPIYVSAPSEAGRHGGVLVGSDGVEALEGGVKDPENTSFTNFEILRTLGTGDDSTTSFNVTVDRMDNYNAESIEIYVDGEAIDLSATENSGTEEDLSASGDYEGTGTLDTDTGEVSFTFESAPEKDKRIEVGLEYDLSGDYYFALFSAAPQKDNVGVEIEQDDDDDNRFTITGHIRDRKGNYSEISGSPWEVDVEDEEATNGFGRQMYITQVFKDHDYIIPLVNEDLEVSDFEDTSDIVDFGGGHRGLEEVSDSVLAEAYDYFKDTSDFNHIDLFFDTTASTEVQSQFSTLRGSSWKYTRFLFPLAPMPADEAIEDPGFSVSDRGLHAYWNYFEVVNIYSNSGNLVTNVMGEVARKHADIITGAFGGLAPAWIDENGMGGQLDSGRIVKAEYSATEDQLKELDEARVNPIVFDRNYGPMIMSRRTTQTALTDYSFIGNSGAADYILRRISQEVLPYQIVKLNDAPHRDSVRNRALAIIDPMLVAPTNVLRARAVKCDEENNNDDVLAQEKFVLDVAVKFTPKSRTIVFSFINTPQTSDIEEAFE